MKTQNITGEGHCGIQVTLNVLDQYAITHAVERIKSHKEQMRTRTAWQNKKEADKVWKMDKEDKDNWMNQNPMPAEDQFDWEEEIIPILNFLNKLTLTEDDRATVFDE